MPGTYRQLRDVAEFFTRPSDGLWGIALYGSADYDACTSAFNNILWSFGGELWNPDEAVAQGYIDSPAAKRALSFYKELFAFAPPGFTDAYVTVGGRTGLAAILADERFAREQDGILAERRRRSRRVLERAGRSRQVSSWQRRQRPSRVTWISSTRKPSGTRARPRIGPSALAGTSSRRPHTRQRAW